ncbi:MAG: hypothetical protein IJN39_03040, partial [Clostridia bacterium]|nr:hypothetical protein [Clostridia bacterium]
YNGENVDFFVTAEGAIGFYTDAALNEDEDTIAITTGSAKFAGDPTNDGVLSAADIIAMKKAVQPADGTSTDAVDGNGDGDTDGGSNEGDNAGAITSYSNGQIANWNGIIANVKGVSGGESDAGAFWYPNETTLADAGYETDVEITFISGQAPKASGGNPWGALSSQVADMAAAYEAGETSFTFDASSYVGQGIALKSNGDDIELSLTVPATGDYKLVARQNSWEAGRMAVLTVNDTALKAISDAVQMFAFAKSEESVHLEAGTTYTATLDGVGGNLVRLDFIALVPAAVADDVAAVAAGIANVKSDEITAEQTASNAAIATEIKDMLAAGNFTTGDVGVKLGTVSAVDNTFVAFGRVKGANDGYGISIQDPETEEYLYDFYAYGVSATPGLSNGGFAIEVIDEDGVSLAEEFGGMNVYAFAIPAGETIDNSVMAGPAVVE